MTTPYSSLRSALSESGSDSRVEVNQRALIDKILARYASENALYRELLQNSNDAEASAAEIHLTTTTTTTNERGSIFSLLTSPSADDSAQSPLFYFDRDSLVTEVVYKNNGIPFRPEDWDRLRRIAEGNPSPEKVGAFGVGAYTMFSVCEEPLVISGNQALSFLWKGDALWTKSGPSNIPEDGWTTFVLPSRDPYPVPDLVEFGQFLCASLTFTRILQQVRVFVDGRERLTISKAQQQEPTGIALLKDSSWWTENSPRTSTPKSIFVLDQSDSSVTERITLISATLDGKRSEVQARYMSATFNTRIAARMANQMERVTKKIPPPRVTVDVLLDASKNPVEHHNNSQMLGTGADAITSAFMPQNGSGSVFIGFRTSQTTGLAAHLAAPLMPTVEREAIDLQEPTLRLYNSELLAAVGILMRLTLEHSMRLIKSGWDENSRAGDKKDDGKTPDGNSGTKEDNNKLVHESMGAGGIFGFTKYFKRKLSDAGNMHENDLHENEQDEIFEDVDVLNPTDNLPLSDAETDAIVLMRAFCPKQSTPDSQVGTIILEGFAGCIPNVSPPTLTKSGFVPGDCGLVPYKGMEAFVKENVVRTKVFKSAEGYHTLVAGCKQLNMEHVICALQGEVLRAQDVVRLLKWWTKYTRVDVGSVSSHTRSLKASVVFVAQNDGDKSESQQVRRLADIFYYADTSAYPDGLPMPETVFPASMQKEVGFETLQDASMRGWFTPLSMDVWADFICNHPSLAEGAPEQGKIRLLALSTLNKEYTKRKGLNRVVFAELLRERLSQRRCIPCEPSSPFTAERPTDMYLSSAELELFEGLGSLNKIPKEVSETGISDDFLFSLGVRKTIAIDFLLSHIDTLKWSDNPKPLISYLRTATLTGEDMEKLRNTEYLPAEADKSRTYKPSDLFLPNEELGVFPFVKLLQWPADEYLTERSADGVFLKTLGCQVDPPLESVLDFLSSDFDDESVRTDCLDFVCNRLGPGGSYCSAYVGHGVPLRTRFVPCLRVDPIVPGCVPRREFHTPNECYSNSADGLLKMGFPILDPELERKSDGLYGTRFKCLREPKCCVLVGTLLDIVALAQSCMTNCVEDERRQLVEHFVVLFNDIFKFLSTKIDEFEKKSLSTLKKSKFIPCKAGNTIEWVQPRDACFESSNNGNSSLAEVLFHPTTFSPFLAALGVKSEASTEDVFRLVISSPKAVLEKVGSEAKYRALLGRIAADPPFKSVTNEMRNSPFLIAYQLETSRGSDDPASFRLAKAEDIYIIDNSLFGRMFPVLCAPPESNLEELYSRVGSTCISQRVKTDYDVVGVKGWGMSLRDTTTTEEVARRIQERLPLLVSPITSRLLLKQDAGRILSEENLSICEASKVKVVYSLGEFVESHTVTSCAKSTGDQKHCLYVTESYDWFDVGNAIGSLILDRCLLEDALLLGSLLEAPFEQLRARGFPVDRILHAIEPAGHSPAQPQSCAKETRSSKKKRRPLRLISNIVRSKRGQSNSAQKETEALKNRPPSPNSGTRTKATAKGALPSTGKKEPTASAPIRTNSSPGGVSSSTAKRSQVQTAGQEQSSTFPTFDAARHRGLEKELKRSVQECRKVGPLGVSVATREKSIPEGPHHIPNFCEVISGHDLKPFNGPYRTGMAFNGVRVFYSRKSTSSEEFLNKNFDAVDAFAAVLRDLCGVYSLCSSSVAIFHEPSGRTIAFNSNKSLYFNLCQFCTLHHVPKGEASTECYSYWYSIMAHELAHNRVSPHNKEHGYYMQSFVSLFLPKLTAFLAQRGNISLVCQ